MIRRAFSIVLTCALMCQVAALAEQTEVTVSKGRVRVDTGKQAALVEAGTKAVLHAAGGVTRTVDDPMVERLLLMDRWVEAERKAARERIDSSTIQVIGVEGRTEWKAATLTEMPNNSSKPSSTLKIGPTAKLKGPKFYDMEGNLLEFEAEDVDANRVCYLVHFREAAPAKGMFRLVMVVRQDISAFKVMWREGKLWQAMTSNDTQYCLNYFEFVLPHSAIFVDSTIPVMLAATVDDRTSVTFRNYTGKSADGTIIVKFLWPDQDGTSLADLPGEYRGLGDARAQEYQEAMKSILAGKEYGDQSTPVAAMLTLHSALINRDTEALGSVAYAIRKRSGNSEEKIREVEKVFFDRVGPYLASTEFLASPDWPGEPEEGHIHPIYVCGKGCRIRIDTLAFIYSGGEWSFIGNTGNPRDTDVGVFTKYK